MKKQHIMMDASATYQGQPEYSGSYTKRTTNKSRSPKRKHFNIEEDESGEKNIAHFNEQVTASNSNLDVVSDQNNRERGEPIDGNQHKQEFAMTQNFPFMKGGMQPKSLDSSGRVAIIEKESAAGRTEA